MKYKIILFDADQTLFDFKRCEYQALSDALCELSLPNDKKYIDRYSEINDMLWKKLEKGETEKSRLVVERFEIFCREFSFDCDVTALSNLYKEKLAKQAFLIDGAEQLVKTLCKDHRLFIITNGIKKVQQGRLALSPIKECFEQVFISEVVGYEKPKREFFDAVMEQIPDFDIKDAIVIGDSLTSDIKGGIDAGIDTCWYNPEGKRPPADMPITYVIKDLCEIYDIV